LIKNLPVKRLLFIIFPVVLLTNCSNPELDALKEKQKDIDCKMEFNKFLRDNSMSTMLLGKEVGLQKELDEFHKIQSDTTASCDSVRNSWTRFQNLVGEKSKSIGK
jgi:hypothetical protein